MIKRTKIYKFKNGATLIYKQRKAFDITAVNVGFFAGYEYCEGKHGLPHLLEHMLMKQTDHRSQEQVIEDKVKITPLNAFTSPDFLVTTFSESNRRVEKCFEFASDCLLSSNFDKDRFEKEKNVVLEERKDRETQAMFDFDYQSANFIRYLSTVQPGYIFGSPEELKSYTIDDLNEYRKKNFVADKFILSVCTSLSFGKIKKLAKKYFVDKLAVSETKSELLPPLDKNIKLDQSMKVYQTPEKNYQVKVYFSLKTEIDEFRISQLVFMALRPLNNMNDMFYYNARKLGLVYSSYALSSVDNLSTDNAVVVQFSTSKFENISKIFDLLNESIIKLKNGIITQEYLDQCKDNAIIKLDSEHYTSYRNNVTDNLEIYQNRRKIEKIPKKTKIKEINAITLDRVNSMINRIFDKNNKLYIFMEGNFEGITVPTIEEYKEQIYKNVD